MPLRDFANNLYLLLNYKLSNIYNNDNLLPIFDIDLQGEYSDFYENLNQNIDKIKNGEKQKFLLPIIFEENYIGALLCNLKEDEENEESTLLVSYINLNENIKQISESIISENIDGLFNVRFLTSNSIEIFKPVYQISIDLILKTAEFIDSENDVNTLEHLDVFASLNHELNLDDIADIFYSELINFPKLLDILRETESVIINEFLITTLITMLSHGVDQIIKNDDDAGILSCIVLESNYKKHNLFILDFLLNHFYKNAIPFNGDVFINLCEIANCNEKFDNPDHHGQYIPFPQILLANLHNIEDPNILCRIFVAINSIYSEKLPIPKVVIQKTLEALNSIDAMSLDLDSFVSLSNLFAREYIDVNITRSEKIIELWSKSFINLLPRLHLLIPEHVIFLHNALEKLTNFDLINFDFLTKLFSEHYANDSDILESIRNIDNKLLETIEKILTYKNLQVAIREEYALEQNCDITVSVYTKEEYQNLIRMEQEKAEQARALPFKLIRSGQSLILKNLILGHSLFGLGEKIEIDINSEYQGQNLISVAIENNELEMVQILVEKGVKCGREELVHATLEGKYDIFLYLIQNINNYREFLSECLDDSAANGHIDIVKYIVENEGFLDFNDQGYCKSLVTAIRYGRVEVAKYFIEKVGFDVEIKSTVDSPIAFAAYLGLSNMIKYLILEQNIDPEAPIFKGASLIELAESSSYNAGKELGAYLKSIEFSGIMLKNKIDSLQKNENGYEENSDFLNLISYCTNHPDILRADEVNGFIKENTEFLEIIGCESMLEFLEITES